MLRATPLGCHQERRTPLNASEHASEAATVKRDCLQDLTTFANTHASLIGNVGVPDGMVGINADAVRRAITEVGPHTPVRYTAVGGDLEGRKPLPLRFGDNLSSEK